MHLVQQDQSGPGDRAQLARKQRDHTATGIRRRRPGSGEGRIGGNFAKEAEPFATPR